MGHRYLCCPHMVTVSKAKHTLACPSVIAVGLSRRLIAGLPLNLKALIESNCRESNVKMRVPKGTLNFCSTGTLRMITKSRNVPQECCLQVYRLAHSPLTAPYLGQRSSFPRDINPFKETKVNRKQQHSCSWTKFGFTLRSFVYLLTSCF